MENKVDDKLAIIVCGSNGAGKSTFIKGVLLDKFHQTNTDILYINADDWQKKEFGRFENDTDDHARQAQQWANSERERCLSEGVSFITETVFSHPSKIDLLKEAKEKGFKVELYHIHVDSADKAIDRIKDRVKSGGHHVNDDKVRARYARLTAIVSEASQYAEHTFVIDNSDSRLSHRFVLKLTQGKLEKIYCPPPAWVVTGYAQQLQEFQPRLEAGYRSMRAVANSSGVVLQQKTGDAWQDVERMPAEGMKAGVYPLGAAKLAAADQSYEGEVVYKDNASIFQQTKQGLVRHQNTEQLAGQVRIGQRYTIGNGQAKAASLTASRSMKQTHGRRLR